MASIPNLESGDIEKLMLSENFENMLSLCNANVATIMEANSGNRPQAESLFEFLKMDFRI